MKSLRMMLAVVLVVRDCGCGTVGPPPSDAEKSFDKMKTLAGTWEGKSRSIPR